MSEPTESDQARGGRIESLRDAAAATGDLAWAAGKIGARAAIAGARVVDSGIRAVAPVTRAVLDPNLLPEPVRPASLLRQLSEERQAELREHASDVTDAVSKVIGVVDVPRIVNQVLDQLNLTEIVEERVDLTGMTERVIEDVDLSAIVEASTGTVASNTVRSVRYVAAQVDEVVSKRVVEREPEIELPPNAALSERAQRLQGRRAGAATRLLAGVVDAVVILALLGIGWVGLAAVKYLARPTNFTWPAVPPLLVYLMGCGVALVMFTLLWGATGRGVGGAVSGTRITTRKGHPIGFPTAFLRALATVVFPLGWLWILVGPRGNAVADLVGGTAVRYDWSRSRA